MSMQWPGLCTQRFDAVATRQQDRTPVRPTESGPIAPVTADPESIDPWSPFWSTTLAATPATTAPWTSPSCRPGGKVTLSVDDSGPGDTRRTNVSWCSTASIEQTTLQAAPDWGWPSPMPSSVPPRAPGRSGAPDSVVPAWRCRGGRPPNSRDRHGPLVRSGHRWTGKPSPRATAAEAPL